jgi:hypothetical protein
LTVVITIFSWVKGSTKPDRLAEWRFVVAIVFRLHRIAKKALELKSPAGACLQKVLQGLRTGTKV